MAITETAGSTTATIAEGDTVSGAVSLVGVTILGLITPAALTGTALTFQVSASAAGAYVPLHDATGAAVSVTVAASRAYYLSPAIFAVWRAVKVVSGSAEAADRTITLLTGPVS